MKVINEILTGIVNRVTDHNPDTCRSVLRVQHLTQQSSRKLLPFTRPKYLPEPPWHFEMPGRSRINMAVSSRQSKRLKRNPLPTPIEKYLGSGLIKAVGPKTVKKLTSFKLCNSTNHVKNKFIHCWCCINMFCK